MIFSSTLFLFLFLPITLLGYYFLKGNCKNYWLLLVSILFFSWSQPHYLWIILLSIIMNYICALLIEKNGQKTILLICAIAGNLSLLFCIQIIVI